MAARYMLDTNVASYIIRGSHSELQARLVALPMEAVVLSAVTEAELLFGVARRPDAHDLATAVREFLLRLERLPWDSEAASTYGPMRAGLQRSGTPLGAHDMMIAAHPVSVGVILVSNDRSFRQVPGLRLEDWTRT